MYYENAQPIYVSPYQYVPQLQQPPLQGNQGQLQQPPLQGNQGQLHFQQPLQGNQGQLQVQQSQQLQQPLQIQGPLQVQQPIYHPMARRIDPVVLHASTPSVQDDITDCQALLIIGLFLYFFGGCIPGLFILFIGGCYCRNKNGARSRSYGKMLISIAGVLTIITLIPLLITGVIGTRFIFAAIEHARNS
jgi:hypothetical protein